MDALSPHDVVALSEDCCNGVFYGMAFDGCFFYLTAPQESSVCKFKRDFTATGRIKTDKPYHCICYDSRERCFWATERRHHDHIYQLDRDMKEIGLLRIDSDQKPCTSIMGLSYDCENDALLAAYKEYIVEVSKKNGRTRMIREAREGFYAAILSIAPYYAMIRQDGKGQSFQIYACDGRRIKNFRIPDLYGVKDVLLYPCNERRRDELEFILLAKKDHCSEHVLLKINVCDLILSGCNYQVCHAHCGGEDDESRCICDVIKSVALVETSLSHILNAEGEKLQKAVELASSVDELLAVNKSVTKAVINIAELEYHLYLKLDALNGLGKKQVHHNDERK